MRSEFAYICPSSLGEALEILKDNGERARVIAGGTDLMTEIREGKLGADFLVDITRIPELRFVREEGDQICLGPLINHAELASSGLIKEGGDILGRAAQNVGSPQIRNMGTIGGNIVNASPAADTIPALVVLGAKVTLQRKGGERTLPITDLYLGPYRTVIEPQEILTEISFAKLDDGWRHSFVKLARRKALAIARINIAALAKVEGRRAKEVRVSVGSCTPTPCRMGEVEALFREEVPSVALIEEAAQRVAQEMVKRSGVRPSTEYKRPAVQGLVKKALLDVFNLSHDA
ncbi:MAG: xanthine dehydrogenase family protein subunit M [Deltaproteobacteria bacterium]|nr:xanthine dehydrogenase family protein subunit M [Deltaproteobacteria bacterium]